MLRLPNVTNGRRLIRRKRNTPSSFATFHFVNSVNNRDTFAAPVSAIVVLLMLDSLSPALADVTYHSYNSIRDWRISGNDTTIVLAFTALFGASVWFVARAIWFRGRA